MEIRRKKGGREGKEKEREEIDHQPKWNPMSHREAGLGTDKAVNCEQLH